MGNIKLCSKKCNQCLFTNNKIVSEERKAEIIKSCVDEDDYFVCHKSPSNEKWICKGFYDGGLSEICRTLKSMRPLFTDLIPEVNPNLKG